ncbi:N-acetylmuramic acid 6-phosphate etherase [Erysipelothrix larvae]|nr:N-acetylmuramic acid 6-phosphate etherase [Erysipelothrix larvae]
MLNLSTLQTEQRNQNTLSIDTLSTLEMVHLINQEDTQVLNAISECAPSIATAIDAIYPCIENKGRLVYMGAGTSGRLGVLDASEWFPTYGVGEESVIGMIAGGDVALRVPIEGAEDDRDQAVKDMQSIHFNQNDVLLAIASSGRTPYCIGALEYAKSLGAKTVSLACVSKSEIGQIADIAIEAITGPEVVTGSTRMKAGSAQKMILNIISTSCMIKYGKVYGNLMVDVKPTNVKLIQRAKNIIQEATGCTQKRASDLLTQSHDNVKVAIVMELMNADYEHACQMLSDNEGRITHVVSR